jgi:spermidine synthase
MPWHAQVLLPALLVLFFASGVSGLIYELVWLRYLSLVFGVTIYAVSTVLSAFMGGLALGGFLAGRFADRVKRPLRIYGLLELGIGLSALLTPPAFRLLNDVYRAVYPALPHDLTSLSLVRFFLACVILLVPTTLMGATLPIVVRSALGKNASLGTNLSLLYGSNTAGGITGAYLAGFVLIGSIGIHATTITAAVLNVGVGIASLAFDWWLEKSARSAPISVPAPADAAGALHPADRVPPAPIAQVDVERAPFTIPQAALRWLLVAFFVSGFASLGFQVIWTRILAIFFEATTYAFTVILCTFLLGIAAGSYAVAPLINRRVNWLFVAATIEWAVGVSALCSIAVISRIPDIIAFLAQLPALEHLVSGEQRSIGLMAFVTIFPTTLLLGAAFPIIMKLYVSGQERRQGDESQPDIARRLGRAYAANVCGAIVGSWASGFVLIPLLGTHRALVLLAAANIALGLILLRYAVRGTQQPAATVSRPHFARARVLVPAGLAVAISAGALTPDMYGAVFSRFGDRVLWYEEGLEQTVTILQGPQVRRMYLNGWHQANDTPSMLRVHSLLGHLPMLVQPGGAAPGATRDVLVIGLGGGATAGAAASHDGAQLQVVELSPSVVRGARFFSHVNENVVDAPNVHVHADDGRNYLFLSDKKYDVIMADAIRPQHAGSSTLYSLEYYQLARAALKDDGVMVQWIDGEIPENQYRILLRTFLRSFPYVTGWSYGSFFIGSNKPYLIDRQVVAQRLEGRGRTVLAPIGLTHPEALFSLFSATDAELRAWVGPGPVVSDDHPYVEFFRSLANSRDPADVSGFRRDWSTIVR